MIVRPFIVIFEGMDKSGKSTLLHAFNKTTDFLHFVIDRGPISNLVYNQIFSRNYGVDYSGMIDHITKHDHLIVYCKADKEVVTKRLLDNNEVLPNHSIYEQNRYLFESFLFQSPFKYVIIDTTVATIDECLDQIQAKLVELS